jgi:hypothetical protein
MAGDLPFNFVKREDQFREIVDQVLDGNRKNPSGRTVVLEGAGGYGKTTLALDVCDDDDVITACDGGILWVTLGEQPRVKDELTSIYAALTGERPQFHDEVEAARELIDRLEGKRCLLVIDDVWQLDRIQPLLHGDGMITRLITTRDSRIAAEAARNPIRLPVAELKPAEAESLLISRLRIAIGDPAPFRKLAERLGNYPLLLELASGALRDREDAKDTLGGALSWMNQALDRKGVLAFNRENARQRHDTIGKTVEISLELLGKERQRCVELGIFPDDVDIPLSVVALIWHVDDFETESLAQRINQLSLAKLNLARRNLRLHDAMRAYMASQLGEAGLRCHAKLSGWWKDPARLPDGYPRRFVAYHVVHAMSLPDEAETRTRQLIDLLTNEQFRTWQHTRGDLVSLNRQLANALKNAASNDTPQAPVWLAAIAVALEQYRVNREPRAVFDLARQGKIAEAVARLDLFQADRDWATASRLLIVWLGSQMKSAQATDFMNEVAERSDKPELQALLAWVREPSGGVPPQVAPVPSSVSAEHLSTILERAGGIEGAEGMEPLNVSGISSDAAGFIAVEDGPVLVDFVNKDRGANTDYLQRYILIHASNRYKYYRNRSLWALLQPVLTRVDNADWVRARVEELCTPALTETSIEFRDFVPLSVLALRTLAGDTAADASLRHHCEQLFKDAELLTTAHGKNDSWSHFQRKAASLAEICRALDKPQEASGLIALARDLPKGFAGFRCFAALTLAEAIGIISPQDVTLRESAFESARAASHRIQDAPFCRDATAIVNAMRSRIWLSSPDEISKRSDVFVLARRHLSSVRSGASKKISSIGVGPGKCCLFPPCTETQRRSSR